MNIEALARIGYEAYGAHAEWKAFDGRPMPRWDDPGLTSKRSGALLPMLSSRLRPLLY